MFTFSAADQNALCVSLRSNKQVECIYFLRKNLQSCFYVVVWFFTSKPFSSSLPSSLWFIASVSQRIQLNQLNSVKPLAGTCICVLVHRTNKTWSHKKLLYSSTRGQKLQRIPVKLQILANIYIYKTFKCSNIYISISLRKTVLVGF